MTDKTAPPPDIKEFTGEPLLIPPATFLGSVEGATVEAVAALAREASAPVILQVPTKGLGPDLPDHVPILWDRHAQKVISVLSEVRAAKPALERVGTAVVTTLASFIELVNRHKDDGSAIFAKTAWPEPKLTAVIDYHKSDETKTARRGKHRIAYPFPLTDEFKVWVAGHGKPFKQADFAEFMEEHAAELAAPDQFEINTYEPMFKERFGTPAEILDLSRHLEVNVGAKMKSAVRNASGERQMVFETEHTGVNGEPIDIPGIFIVSVAPFLAGDAEPEVVRIPARLRYRAAGGEVVWFYQLYRWEFFLRERVQGDLARATKETSLPAFEGAPEMAA
ncbi:DUF2303 family protein [Xanthobacter wiegelii]|uniref:DUF2303 family protein n=1 Tax=Xanthobacter wiegelii TaxID=3119913 RepID=UPI00372B278C